MNAEMAAFKRLIAGIRRLWRDALCRSMGRVRPWLWYRPPLCLWLIDTPRASDDDSDEMDSDDALRAWNRSDFYLMPNGLKLDFHLIGLSFALLVSWHTNAIMGLITWAALSLLVPIAIYVSFRLPVPLGHQGAIPRSLASWMTALPSRALLRYPAWKVYATALMHCLAVRSGRTDSLHWRISAGPRRALLTVALRSFFEPLTLHGPRDDPSDQPDASSLDTRRGFTRWLFYYCAPVWVSYAAILVVTFSLPLTIAGDIILTILWVAYGVAFLMRHASFFESELLGYPALGYLPAWAKKELRQKDIPLAWTNTAFAIVMAAFTSAHLVFIGYLNSP